MVLLEAERKGRILTKAQFGCLQGIYTLNLTRGCEFRCVYCYARGYKGAPPSGEVHLYQNFSEKLAKELDSPRRRSPVPSVTFNTASDSFQSHPKILDLTYGSMKVLLERGIEISFLTKGRIPRRFIDLFAAHPGLVTSRIGLVSLSPRYRDLFEPGAATAAERLQNIDRLGEKGVDVEVRIDPIIPFFTDDERSIGALYQALSKRGIRRVSISYLHLRPPIIDQLRRELPNREYALIRSCFNNQPWRVVGSSTRSKLIPLPLREKGYRRFMDLSQGFGLTSLICSCKNPDMEAHRCVPWPPAEKSPETGGQGGKQLSLFPC